MFRRIPTFFWDQIECSQQAVCVSLHLFVPPPLALRLAFPFLRFVALDGPFEGTLEELRDLD